MIAESVEETKTKYSCPNCADFMHGRVYFLNEKLREALPLCKHCGAQCEDSGNDDRWGDICAMEEEIDDIEKDLSHMRARLARHKEAWDEDWNTPNPHDEEPIYTETRYWS